MICFLVKLNLRLVCPYLSGFGPVVQKSKVNNGFCQKSADSECRRLAVKFDSQEICKKTADSSCVKDDL